MSFLTSNIKLVSLFFVFSFQRVLTFSVAHARILMRDEYAISVKFLDLLQVTYRVPFFMVESSEEPMAAGPFALLIQFAFKL